MKLLRPILAVVVLAVAAPVAAQPATASPTSSAAAPSAASPRAEVEAYIRRSAQQWAEVPVTGDVGPLRTFIADDYSGVSSRGVVRDKSTMLADSARDSEFISSQVDYINLRWIGDATVIAQGAEDWERRTKEPRRGRLIWTDVWMLRNGRWQVVTSQDSPMPPRPRP